MKLCEMSSIFSSVAFLLLSSGRTFSTAVVTLLYFFMLSVSCYLHYMCLCQIFSVAFPIKHKLSKQPGGNQAGDETLEQAVVEVVDVTFLEAFKAGLGGAVRNLIQ